jgi:hypothetical protein
MATRAVVSKPDESIAETAKAEYVKKTYSPE